MMHYEDIKDMLCDELEHIADDGVTSSNLETIDLLTHSIKSLATIIAMEGYDGRKAKVREYPRRYNTGRDHFVRQLEELMQSAPDDRIRNQLRKTISDANNTPE